MKHLIVGLFALSLLIISFYYKVFIVDLKILHKNAGKILVWIARLMLGAIITSWLK